MNKLGFAAWVKVYGTLKFGDILDCTNPCIEFGKSGSSEQLRESVKVVIFVEADEILCAATLLRKDIKKC